MLEKLFNPSAIAVIGASREEGKVGHSLLKNLKDMAIVATSEEVAGEKVVAVGRYLRARRDEEVAEVAFLVRDDWQNRGMGRTLLAQLIEIAKGKGIEGFVASVLPTNKQMLAVFHTCGYRLRVAIEEGVFQLSFRFDEPD